MAQLAFIDAQARGVEAVGAGVRVGLQAPDGLVHVRRAARYASDPRAIEDVASTGKKNAHELWRKVDEKIGEGPWALGERYSVADPLLVVYWIWGRGQVLGFDMTNDFPHWTAHARRLAARSAVQRAFASEGLTLPT